MTLHVKDGGTWKTPVVSGVSVKDAGTWKTVTDMYVKKDSTWIKFYPAFTTPPPPETSITVTVSPTIASGSGTAGTVTSNSVTASASGGTGPYTYNWTRVSGDDIVATASNNATTAFSATVANGQTKRAIFRVEAADSAKKSATKEVEVTLSASGSALSAYSTPSAVSATITGAGTATTNSASAIASGGSGSYTYSWTIVSGTCTIASPNSSATQFYRTLTNGQTAFATAKCTVTDTGGATVDTSTVSISFTSNSASSPLSATRSPATLSQTGTWTSGNLNLTTSSCSVSASGGTPGYTYSWSRVSGSALVNITSPSSSSTTFNTSFNGGGQTRSAVFKCTVTDAASNVVDTDTVSVTFNSLQALAANSGPTANSASSSSDPVFSSGYTCVASGGVGPYTYTWQYVSGSTAMSIGNVNNATTAFFWNSLGVPGTISANYRCVVTDSNGTSVNSNAVVVQLTRT